MAQPIQQLQNMIGQRKETPVESDSKVYQTKNYGIFRSLKGNRKVEKKHVTNLTVSIMRSNLLEQNPIIVNENFEVIDGQHRLEVARNNDLEIYYVIKNNTALQEVQMLNANMKRWSTKDYLDSYISIGKEPYIKLAEYSAETGMTIANAMVILGGRGASLSTVGLRQRFRAGEFEIENPELGEMFKDILEDLKQVTEFTEENDNKLLVATSKVLKQIDFQEMIRQFEASGKKIRRAGAIRDYLRQYEDVFNYNKRTQTRFY